MRPLVLALALSIALSLCPAAGAAAAEEDRFAQRLVELVNEYRVRKGLPALVAEPAIAALAREHSAAMAAVKRVNHDDFPSRVQRSGRAMCVENVGWNYRSPEAQFEGWRTSPGHDGNMLDARAVRVGIGVAADYVTLIACQ